MTDYVTAGELRALGIPIPERIPDVARVPRSAIRTEVEDAEEQGDGAIRITITYRFDATFEWIEASFTIG